MDVSECIRTRRSIRRYFDIPVPFEYVAQILDAGIHAPTAGNLQAIKFIVVTDEQKKLKIADACMTQSWISTAPVIIIICSEAEKLDRMYGLRGKKLYSTQDCTCAAENMLLEAHNLDLGACFVSAFENEPLADILDIPKDIIPMVIIPLGYPDEQVPKPSKYELRDVTFFNNWDNKDVSTPWPLIKFAKPLEKKAKQVGSKLKESIYNFIDNLNKKQKKDINKTEVDRRLGEDHEHFIVKDNKEK